MKTKIYCFGCRNKTLCQVVKTKIKKRKVLKGNCLTCGTAVYKFI